MVLLTTPRRDRLAALERFAGRQFGTFSWKQALSTGMPSSTLSDAIRDGVYKRVQPAVYTSHVGQLDLDTRRAAALLAIGDDSALMARAALHLYECSRFRSRAVHIGVSRRTRRNLRNARVSRSSAFAAGYVTTHKGHRVTSLAWTITDLGLELEPEQIANVIQQGRLRCRLKLEDLDAILRLRGRFPGRVNVVKALAMYRAGSSGTRSSYEDVVYAWIKSWLRKPPLPNVHVRVGNEEFEVDIPLISRMLCIEVDGPLHDEPDQQERDRVRDAALRASGYRVLRIHWRDIRDRPEWCQQQLRAAIGI